MNCQCHLSRFLNNYVFNLVNMANKYLSWYKIFALIFAVVLWNCFANFNVKSIFFLGKTKINHFYSDTDFQQWVLCCHWFFIYSIPIGLDAKKGGKIVKDTRYSLITQRTFWPLQISNIVHPYNLQSTFLRWILHTRQRKITLFIWWVLC